MEPDIFKLLNRVKDLKFDVTRKIEGLNSTLDATGDRRTMRKIESLSDAYGALSMAEDHLSKVKNQ